MGDMNICPHFLYFDPFIHPVMNMVLLETTLSSYCLHSLVMNNTNMVLCVLKWEREYIDLMYDSEVFRILQFLVRLRF
jgi:hypothetical protein